LLQSQIEKGPCVDCIREDSTIHESDLARAQRRWPRFAPAAAEAGFGAVLAVPMRLDGHPVGGLNLLYDEPTTPSDWQPAMARAFADLTVLGLVQERDGRRADRLVEHTLGTLNERTHMSQAVGVMAGATGLDPHAARLAVRSYALQHRLRLAELARAITSRDVDPAKLVRATANPRQPDTP
jgi:GAF domain-containing protein